MQIDWYKLRVIIYTSEYSLWSNFNTMATPTKNVIFPSYFSFKILRWNEKRKFWLISAKALTKYVIEIVLE